MSELTEINKNVFGLDVKYIKIDHLAIAVHDLEAAIDLYGGILGFKLAETRETRGKETGMVSCVMAADGFNIVLLQGTEPESQVCKFIERYGAGVQHVAFEVECLDKAIELLSQKGVEFSTGKISGFGLKQIFSRRDENSGMMIELIERNEMLGFEDGNVQSLFDQLEKFNLI